MLAALRLSLSLGDDAGADAELLAQVADLDGLAEFAATHQVCGLLRRHAEVPQGQADAALAALIAKLRPRRVAALRRGMRQLDGLRRLATGFAERDTPFLVLKGLPLAQRLYGDPFVRDAVDIDLLVAPESFPEAREAVRAAGFEPAKLFHETPLRNRWAQRVKKEETFTRRGVWLELHRRTLGNPYYLDVPFAHLHERRTMARIGPDLYPTQAPEDELLYLMCHGVGHGWKLLKWLCDVALRLDRSDDAELARTAACCERAGIDVVWHSTLLACQALGVTRSTGAAEGWQARAVARMLPEIWRTGRWPPFWRKVPLRVALKPNLRFALHELVRVMVVPEDWQRVDLPDRLFFLYFFLRPWLYAKDALLAARSEPPRSA